MQFNYLYRDAIYQRYNLERETLKNSLTIATQTFDEFAFNFMKDPGCMAIVAGEVVHVVKCIPVKIIVKCRENYDIKLQVSRKNRTYFMIPPTHILISKNTHIPYNILYFPYVTSVTPFYGCP